MGQTVLAPRWHGRVGVVVILSAWHRMMGFGLSWDNRGDTGSGGGGAAVGAGPSALEESAGPKRGALKASGFGD